MQDPLGRINVRTNPAHPTQLESADPRQHHNHAGGFGFSLTSEERLRRFLILGTVGGSCYQGEQELTRENAGIVLQWAADDPIRLVELLSDVARDGRAPKQNPVIFALAVATAAPDEAGRRAAFDAMPAVLRTGRQLALFVSYVRQFRGWGSGLMRAGRRWYGSQSVDELAYQLVKYRQRDGYAQRDLLRLIHPRSQEQTRNALYRWITQGASDTDLLPKIIKGYRDAQQATDVTAWVRIVHDHRLTWEMLPEPALAEPEVWAALIDQSMPVTALIRQLPRLTRLGVIGRPFARADRTEQVSSTLHDRNRLTKAMIHPFNVLVALRTYAAGRSFRGSSTWEPATAIIDALDEAFYLCYGNVIPAGRRTMIGLDVSGSMTAPVAGSPLTAREASAAMSLITAATEPATATYAFTAMDNPWREAPGISELAISPRQRLDDVIRTVSGLQFGRTDCALPMIKALELGLEIDTFVVITDNETWAGRIHPHRALLDYRSQTGIDARLAVWGMTATDITIADPDDQGMLDLVGLDAAAPQLLADFSAGRI